MEPGITRAPGRYMVRRRHPGNGAAKIAIPEPRSNTAGASRGRAAAPGDGPLERNGGSDLAARGTVE